MSRGHEGCWVSQFVHYARLLRRREIDDAPFTTAWRRGMYRSPEGVWAFTPLTWIPHVDAPFLGGAWVGRNTMRWTWPSTRRSLAKIGFDRPDILWHGLPRTASLQRCVRPRNEVYLMSDLFTGFLGQPAATEELETEICRRSNVVFAAAQPLVERAQQWSDRVVYLPNAVRIERFDPALLAEPDDLAGIPHPRVIYVGAVTDYVDMDVFETIACARPDTHVVIVGPSMGIAPVVKRLERDLKRLSRMPNIHYLGPCCFERVPSYMSYADVGLMPFRACDLRHAASPLKLFEYAAAGLPVVSRALRESQYACGDALFYDTPEECVQRVDEALANRGDLGRRMRAFAERNTWDSRYETIAQSLATYGVDV
jgi:glycosyltransferase involved in cell wall biosynthesis